VCFSDIRTSLSGRPSICSRVALLLVATPLAGLLSCAWWLTVWSPVHGPREPTSGYVKLLLPPRQSRGNSLVGLDGDPSDAILGGTCSLKIEFRFLNGYLIVPGGPSAYLLVDDHATISPLEVLMKRYLGVVVAAALLVGMMAVATDALAAGHGGGGGRFGGGHMGGGFRRPLLESVPSIPPPIFNPSTPYTVPASPETPVSPASPGSVFGNG